MWTVIISLRREDAESLGYNTGERWRDMLRTQTAAIAKNFKIPIEDLKWYAAFHNESHHLHVHLIVYTSGEHKPYLSKQGVINLRSSFAKDIFAQDLLCVYEKQTGHRGTIRFHGREIIAEIVGKINAGAYDNPDMEKLLTRLSRPSLQDRRQESVWLFERGCQSNRQPNCGGTAECERIAPFTTCGTNRKKKFSRSIRRRYRNAYR